MMDADGVLVVVGALDVLVDMNVALVVQCSSVLVQVNSDQVNVKVVSCMAMVLSLGSTAESNVKAGVMAIGGTTTGESDMSGGKQRTQTVDSLKTKAIAQAGEKDTVKTVAGQSVNAMHFVPFDTASQGIAMVTVLAVNLDVVNGGGSAIPNADTSTEVFDVCSKLGTMVEALAAIEQSDDAATALMTVSTIEDGEYHHANAVIDDEGK